MEFLVASLTGVLKIYVLVLVLLVVISYFENSGTTFIDALKKVLYPYILVSLVMLSCVINYTVIFESGERDSTLFYILPMYMGSILVSLSWGGVLGLKLPPPRGIDNTVFEYFEKDRKLAVWAFFTGIILILIQLSINAELISMKVEEFYSYP